MSACGWRKWHGKEERVGEEGDGESDMLSKDASRRGDVEPDIEERKKKRLLDRVFTDPSEFS